MSRIKEITSAENPHYKELRKLADTPRERRKSGKTLLDGVHLLQALADSGGVPDELIVRDGEQRKAEIEKVIARFPEQTLVVLSSTLFDVLSPVETPSGLLALFTIPHAEIKDSQCAVLLENIQEPNNIGAILRTAAAAGVDAIFLSKGCAEAWSPKALRAAMGAHFVLAIREQADLGAIAKNYQQVIATRLDAEQSLYDLDLRGSVAFVFGNEGAGLSEELSKAAAQQVTIPMPGRMESLNVGAAVAVCLFERVRQGG
jgi:TrmH family RNA methyltransferase